MEEGEGYSLVLQMTFWLKSKCIPLNLRIFPFIIATKLLIFDSIQNTAFERRYIIFNNSCWFGGKEKSLLACHR